MIEKGFKKEMVAILLPMFDFLRVINRNGIERGVEYIREKVNGGKDLKKSEKILLDKFLDQYFIKTWLKRFIDIFNYNDGEGVYGGETCKFDIINFAGFSV